MGYWMEPFLEEGLSFKGAVVPGSDDGGDPGKWLALWLAPRGSGKSHVGTIGEIVYDICFDRDDTHLIVGETRDTALLMLQATKAILEEHPNIIKYFGQFKGPTWRTTAFTVSGRTRFG